METERIQCWQTVNEQFEHGGNGLADLKKKLRKGNMHLATTIDQFAPFWQFQMDDPFEKNSPTPFPSIDALNLSARGDEWPQTATTFKFYQLPSPLPSPSPRPSILQL